MRYDITLMECQCSWTEWRISRQGALSCTEDMYNTIGSSNRHRFIKSILYLFYYGYKEVWGFDHAKGLIRWLKGNHYPVAPWCITWLIPGCGAYNRVSSVNTSLPTLGWMTFSPYKRYWAPPTRCSSITRGPGVLHGRLLEGGGRLKLQERVSRRRVERKGKKKK